MRYFFIFCAITNIIYGFDTKKYKEYLKYKEYFDTDKKNKAKFLKEIRFRGCNQGEYNCVFEVRNSFDDSVLDFIVFKLKSKKKLLYKRTLSLKNRSQFLEYLNSKYGYNEFEYKGIDLLDKENSVTFLDKKQVIRVDFNIQEKKNNWIIDVIENHEIGEKYHLLTYPVNHKNLINDLRVKTFIYLKNSGGIFFILRYNRVGSNSYEEDVVGVLRDDLNEKRVYESNNFSLTNDQREINFLYETIFYRNTLNVESNRSYYLDGRIR